MTFEIHTSSTIDETEWNDNLCKNNASTIYQSYNWQKLYREAFGSKPIFITVTDTDGTVVGQLACLIHKKMLWEDANPLSKKLGNALNLGTSLWWYQGPIIHDAANSDEILSLILSTVDEIAQKNHVINIRGISPSLSEQFPTKIFHKFGYDSEPRQTFVIDLQQNMDDLYNSLKKDTRYYIRKSEREGFEFDIAKNEDAMVKFQDLKVESNIREGKKPFQNLKFWKKHWEIMKKNGFEELVLAKRENKIEGTILTLFFNGNVIQHALANTPGEYLVGTFLTWNTIKWLQKMKFRTFDFAGVDPSPKTDKEKGIYFYAAKFGGKKTDFFSYTKIIDKKKYYLTSGLKNPKRIVSKYQSYKDKKIRKKDDSK